MFKPALNAALIFGLIGVALGALGAHALKPPVLTEELHHAFETAVRYQFYHSFALLFSAILYFLFPDKWIKRATLAFVIGILLFSGSIYLLIFLKAGLHLSSGIIKFIGPITPLGGLCLIAGWIFLLLGINNKRQKFKKDKSKRL